MGSAHASYGFSGLGGGGGAKRNRTADLLHAMQTLYQLSYSPLTPVEGAYRPGFWCDQGVVDVRGVCVKGRDIAGLAQW